MSDYMKDMNGIVTTGLEAAASVAKHSTSKKAGKDLQMEDFLQLMVATFQNQTIDNQADISDMMNQMVQMSVVQAITNISTVITDTTNMTYAASLVGKNVTIAQQDGRTTYQTSGTVTGTGMLNGSPVIFIGDKSYWLSDVLAVGDLPSDEAQLANANAQADEGAESWHEEWNAAASMDAAARAALNAKDDTVDALLEALKPSDDDKRADAIADILTGKGDATSSLLELLGSTDNSNANVMAQLLSAIDTVDNNGNVTVPVEVLEDAVQQIGNL